MSSVPPTALSSGAQKLGQPVPLSNFVVEENSVEIAARAGENALRVPRAASGLVNGRSVPACAGSRYWSARQQLAPFGIGVRDLEGFFRSALRGRRAPPEQRGDSACGTCLRPTTVSSAWLVSSLIDVRAESCPLLQEGHSSTCDGRKSAAPSFSSSRLNHDDRKAPSWSAAVRSVMRAPGRGQRREMLSDSRDTANEHVIYRVI